MLCHGARSFPSLGLRVGTSSGISAATEQRQTGGDRTNTPHDLQHSKVLTRMSKPGQSTFTQTLCGVVAAEGCVCGSVRRSLRIYSPRHSNGTYCSRQVLGEFRANMLAPSNFYIWEEVSISQSGPRADFRLLRFNCLRGGFHPH